MSMKSPRKRPSAPWPPWRSVLLFPAFCSWTLVQQISISDGGFASQKIIAPALGTLAIDRSIEGTASSCRRARRGAMTLRNVGRIGPASCFAQPGWLGPLFDQSAINLCASLGTNVTSSRDARGPVAPPRDSQGGHGTYSSKKPTNTMSIRCVARERARASALRGIRQTA